MTAVTTFCVALEAERDHVHAHFEARGHHAQRIVHAGLLVENEFLRQQVQNFAVGGQRDGARLVDRLANFVAGNFARTRAEGDATVAVQSADVRPGHADQRMLDRRTRRVFRAFDGFLNRSDGFLQIDDDALARAARLGDCRDRDSANRCP